MGGQFGQDLAAIGLGASQAFNENTMQQLFQRRAQEEDTLRQTTQALAQSGQLHLLPSEMTQGIAKRLGKDGLGVLSQLSQLKEQELAPMRGLQADARSLIQAPVQETLVDPERPILASIQEAQPTAAPTALATAVRELPVPQQEFTTSQPEQVRQVTRAPTAAERIDRLQGMEPLIVALATGDVSYGQLQLGSRQVAQKELASRIAKKRLAFEQMTSSFDKAQTILSADGRRVRVVPIFQQDGSTQMMEIGEVPESGQLARLTQKIGRQMGELAKGDALPPEDRKRIERQMILDSKALKKAMDKGGVTINNEPGTMLFDENNQPFYIGAASKARQAQEDRRAAAIYGSPQEIRAARTTNTQGGLVMKQIQDVRDVFRPEFFGVGGFALRLTENTLANIEGGQRFLEVVNNYTKGGALTRNILDSTQFVVEDANGNIDRSASSRFAAKINKRLTGEVGGFDRLLDILVINNLKLRDPSVVREGEYNRELANLTRSGAAGFMKALDVLEDDTLARMDIAERTIQAAQEYHTFRSMIESGADPQEASRVLQTRDPGRQALPVPAGELLQERQLARAGKEEAAQVQARERRVATITRQVASELGIDLQNDQIRQSIGQAVRQFSQSEAASRMTEQEFTQHIRSMLQDPIISNPVEAQLQSRQPTQAAAPLPVGAELEGAPPEVRGQLDRLQQRAESVLGTGQNLRISDIPPENLNAVIVTLLRESILNAGLRPSDIPRDELVQLGNNINTIIREQDMTEQEIRALMEESIAPFTERRTAASGG